MKSPPWGPRLKPFGLPQSRQKTLSGLSSGRGEPINELAVIGGDGNWEEGSDGCEGMVE